MDYTRHRVEQPGEGGKGEREGGEEGGEGEGEGGEEGGEG